MISPSEMVARLQRVRQDLERTRARDMLVIGLDAIALIKQRVINKALDDEGQSFGIYSDAYQKQRGRENLTERPFPRKNYKRTTRMWNNTTASIIKSETGAVTVRLAPVSAGEVQKLKWNEQRDGKTIIKPSKRESSMIQRAIEQRYRRVLINNGII